MPRARAHVSGFPLLIPSHPGSVVVPLNSPHHLSSWARTFVVPSKSSYPDCPNPGRQNVPTGGRWAGFETTSAAAVVAIVRAQRASGDAPPYSGRTITVDTPWLPALHAAAVAARHARSPPSGVACSAVLHRAALASTARTHVQAARHDFCRTHRACRSPHRKLSSHSLLHRSVVNH
eukprot:6174447-Pleurochrysis_carterae.AAC.2